MPLPTSDVHSRCWSSIPHDILVKVFKLLPVHERTNLNKVCKSWSDCFSLPELWSHLIIKIDEEIDQDGKAISCIDQFWFAIRDVEIHVNYLQQTSHDRAFYVMDKLASLPQRTLRKFVFRYIGFLVSAMGFAPNQQYLRRITKLLDYEEQEMALEVVDLNHCNVKITKKLISLVSEQHKCLRVLCLQTTAVDSDVEPSDFLSVIQLCPYLEELHTFYHCVDHKVIEAICVGRSQPFRFLSVAHFGISGKSSPVDTWKHLIDSQAQVEIELKFELVLGEPGSILEFMPVGLPLASLHLTVSEKREFGIELRSIASQFSATLRHVTVRCTADDVERASDDLEAALTCLVSNCNRLENLHCNFALKSEVFRELRAATSDRRCTLDILSESETKETPELEKPKKEKKKRRWWKWR